MHHYYPMRPETYSTTFKAIAYIHNLQVPEKQARRYCEQAFDILASGMGLPLIFAYNYVMCNDPRTITPHQHG